MNKEFWDEHYKHFFFKEASSFAEFVLPFIRGSVVEIGAGDGRDIEFFLQRDITIIGVDQSNDSPSIIRSDATSFMKKNSPAQNTYTRFFWHATDRDVQLEVLRWVRGRLFIEARTTEDRPKNLFGEHKRNLVEPGRLLKDLGDHGFKILYLHQGKGLSRYKDEDPHLIRVIADKN